MPTKYAKYKTNKNKWKWSTVQLQNKKLSLSALSWTNLQKSFQKSVPQGKTGLVVNQNPPLPWRLSINLFLPHRLHISYADSDTSGRRRRHISVHWTTRIRR